MGKESEGFTHFRAHKPSLLYKVSVASRNINAAESLMLSNNTRERVSQKGIVACN